MSENMKVPFHEIDFLLPVHRFNISFSYISQKSLSFMREFILRLIHLGPMQPFDIAGYFDLTERELDEALSDLLSKGDIQYDDDGQVSLTPQARGYFTKMGSAPLVPAVGQMDCTLGFDLAAFNCLGSLRNNGNWLCGFPLEIDNENIGLSDKFAKKHFQLQFYSILDAGYIKNIQGLKTESQPSIYKLDSVLKIGGEPKRVKQKFYMDENGVPFDRDDLDDFEDDEPIVELITKAIAKNLKGNNLESINLTMDKFDDVLTRQFISNSGVDVESLVLEIARAKNEDSINKLFLGPIYSTTNWLIFERMIESVIKDLTSSPQGLIAELIWLAPSDSFWGRSERLLNALHFIRSESTFKGKGLRKLYKAKVYLPLSGNRDKRGKNLWKNQLGSLDNINAIAEGFRDGNIEVMIVANKLAIICYHIVIPEISPIPIPFGFSTTDKDKIMLIASEFSEYLASNHDSDKPNDLGEMKGIG
ncbi:MAG: hypothetical protein ACJAYN_000802 [Bermanella sp.]|jgi:hypothetical protein